MKSLKPILWAVLVVLIAFAGTILVSKDAYNWFHYDVMHYEQVVDAPADEETEDNDINVDVLDPAPAPDPDGMPDPDIINWGE